MEYDESLLRQRVHDVRRGQEEAAGRLMSLHCGRCSTVLGDSLSLCAELKSPDCIVCLRVTGDVVIGDAKETGPKGDMANCIYSSLKCVGCRCTVGRVIHSAPAGLATIRSLFLLYKANISCYILNSSAMVQASTLTFDMKPLGENIDEVRKQFEDQLDQMSRVKSRLIDSVNSKLKK